MVGRFARYRFVVLIGLVALLASACAPQNGLYTGNVTLTRGVYRIGPFNLAPMDQAGSENEATQANVPRPPGNVGIKSMRFDLVDANGNQIPAHGRAFASRPVDERRPHFSDLSRRRGALLGVGCRAHATHLAELLHVRDELD